MGHRQSSRAGCTASLMVLGLLLAGVAHAQVDVGITVTPALVEAPAQLVLTATVSGGEALSLVWDGLGWPPCRGVQCRLAAPLARCQRVGVEVTDLLGAVATAQTFACAGGGPQVSLELQTIADGWRVVPPVTQRWQRFYWNDQEMPLEPLKVPLEPGCQVVELWTVDAEGRLSTDQRRLCSDPAPVIHLGLTEVCPEPGTSVDLCLEVSHPFGVRYENRNGPDPGECQRREAPLGLRRWVMSLAGDDGSTLWVSALGCGLPLGPPVGFYGVFDAWVDERKVTAQPRLLGGEGPFLVSATLVAPSGINSKKEVRVNDREPMISLVPADISVGTATISVEITDARGLTVLLEGQVELPPAPASSTSLGAGCTAIHWSSNGFLVLLLLGLRRRR